MGWWKVMGEGCVMTVTETDNKDTLGHRDFMRCVRKVVCTLYLAGVIIQKLFINFEKTLKWTVERSYCVYL